MITQDTIDRRYRRILKKFGLILHRWTDEHGRLWYYIREAAEDQRAPDEESMEWMSENQLINFVEEREEDLKEWRFEERQRRAEALL